MKLFNVYDSVNTDRLLGQHPGWGGPHDHYRFASYENVSVMYFDPGSINNVSVDYVEFRRVVKQSDNGWKAEVALVTSAPLGALMRLREFRLPAKCGGYPMTAVYVGPDRDCYGKAAYEMYARDMYDRYRRG